MGRGKRSTAFQLKCTGYSQLYAPLSKLGLLPGKCQTTGLTSPGTRPPINAHIVGYITHFQVTVFPPGLASFRERGYRK